MNLISKILQLAFVKTLVSRLINRYTSSGIIIVLMQLEQLGVIAKGTSEQVNGLPSGQIAIWLSIGVGVWLIWHIPGHIHIKNKLERVKYDIELAKAEEELRELKGRNQKRGAK